MPSQLVINADDLGLARGATEGVIRAHLDGVVTSASLVATTADYTEAVERCRRECPELSLGLHFTLSAGRPVSPTQRVPLLVDDRGYLRWRFTSLLRAAGVKRNPELLRQIAIELDAQLDRLAADGLMPDHVDSERHIHQIPGIFELVAAAAERRGIRWIRLGSEIGWRLGGAARLVAAARGGAVKHWLLDGLGRRNRQRAGGLGWCPDFASYLFSGRLHEILDEIARHPPGPGPTEIMVHPGVPGLSARASLGNRALERYLCSPDRAAELDACVAVRRRLAPERLTSFSRL